VFCLLCLPWCWFVVLYNCYGYVLASYIRCLVGCCVLKLVCCFRFLWWLLLLFNLLFSFLSVLFVFVVFWMFGGLALVFVFVDRGLMFGLVYVYFVCLLGCLDYKRLANLGLRICGLRSFLFCVFLIWCLLLFGMVYC